MTEKTKIDKQTDKLILSAKKLALIELQIKVKEQLEQLDNELMACDSDDEDIPF